MGNGKPGEKGGVLAEQEPVRYLIFDIESVADGALVAKVRYPGESLSPDCLLYTTPSTRDRG